MGLREPWFANTLFITNVEGVTGFDLTTRSTTFNIDFSSIGTVVLNGITEDEHPLYLLLM